MKFNSKYDHIHCISDISKLANEFKTDQIKNCARAQWLYNITDECEYKGHPYYINITNEATNKHNITISTRSKRYRPMSNILYYTKKRISGYWYRRDDDY